MDDVFVVKASEVKYLGFAFYGETKDVDGSIMPPNVFIACYDHEGSKLFSELSIDNISDRQELFESPEFQKIQDFFSNRYPMKGCLDRKGIHFEYLDKVDLKERQSRPIPKPPESFQTKTPT